MASSQQQILKEIKNTVLQAAPTATVILYGSRARGEQHPGSDWDVLILINTPKLSNYDHDTIAYPLYELGWRINEIISPRLYTTYEWEKRSFLPFYKNIKEEGIIL